MLSRLLFSPTLTRFLVTRRVALLAFTKRSCGLLLIWSMRWLVHFIHWNWPNLNY